MEFGEVADALRLAAERAPGSFVAGWTDRTVVAPEFVPVWNSFCSFAWWPEHGPQHVIDWVRTHFPEETAAGQRVVIDVFLELLRTRRELVPEAKEPS